MSDNKNLENEKGSDNSYNTNYTSKELQIKTESENSTAATSTIKSSTSGTAKRAFVPNLAVDRSRKDIVKQEIETESQKQPQKRERKPPGPNLNAARGRGNRGQPNLIQSHSVFEAGPAESTKRWGSNSNINDSSFTRTIGSVSSSGSGPTLSERTLKREPNSSHQADSKLKLEDTILIENPVEDESAAYVKLKVDLKDLDSKTASLDDANSKDLKILNELFNQDENEQSNEKLILFQIPENLNLQELDEGHIGKLKIRKSGRIELCIDNENYLNVSLSVSGSFLQDAAAIDLNEQSIEVTNESKKSNVQGGKIINLGHVNGKVVCSPRF